MPLCLITDKIRSRAIKDCLSPARHTHIVGNPLNHGIDQYYELEESTCLSMGGPKSDQIAACVLNAFDALPSKFKPLRNGDVTEWVPLSGIVLEMPSHGDSVDQADAINLVCISAWYVMLDQYAWSMI